MITESLLTGINVRADADIDYAVLICTGQKNIETRDTNSLKAYVGKRVRIIATGRKNSKAMIVGECTIGEPILYSNEVEFEVDYSRHLVQKNSKYWIKQGKVKYGYPIFNPTLYHTAYLAVGRGIVARLNQPSPL